MRLLPKNSKITFGQKVIHILRSCDSDRQVLTALSKKSCFVFCQLNVWIFQMKFRRKHRILVVEYETRNFLYKKLRHQRNTLNLQFFFSLRQLCLVSLRIFQGHFGSVISIYGKRGSFLTDLGSFRGMELFCRQEAETDAKFLHEAFYHS